MRWMLWQVQVLQVLQVLPVLLAFGGTIEDAMDASKSPCDNFHEYACGEWHATYQQRALGAHDMRSQLRALSKQLLVRHFEARGEQAEQAAGTGRGTGTGTATGQDQLAAFYDSCLSGRQALHVYVDAVRQLLPDWPLLNNATHFDWARGGAALRRFGAPGLWRLHVQPNWQSAEQSIFYLLPPSFELLGSGEEAEFLHQRYLKNLLLELGLRVRQAATLATRLVAFERQLQELLLLPSRHVLHAPQTLQQLAEQLPQLQLIDYFEQLLGDSYTPQLLIVADVAYLEQLPRVLHATDALVLSTWLLLQLPAHFELRLHEESTLAAQRQHCLQQLNDLLPQQLTQLLLLLQHGSEAAATAYLQRAQQQLQQLFVSLKVQFERLLNATPIFEKDAATQTLALQKLQAMKLLLPTAPQQQQQPPQQQQQPKEQLINYDSYLLHLSKAKAWEQFQLALNCLQLPCESRTQILGPLDVNVYYRLKLNAVELPLGLLRPPLLPVDGSEPGSPQLLAGLGYMIGHELIHGFDYDGINYDALGRIAGGQWPARAIIRFGLRAGCYLSARYSSATLSINENIADSEGLRLAYEAYREQEEQREKEQREKEQREKEQQKKEQREKEQQQEKDQEKEQKEQREKEKEQEQEQEKEQEKEQQKDQEQDQDQQQEQEKEQQEKELREREQQWKKALQQEKEQQQKEQEELREKQQQQQQEKDQQEKAKEQQEKEQPEQLHFNATLMRPFFVAFAQNWCGHRVAPSSDGAQQQHASHHERVNNVLGNFPEFAQAFDCKAGSLMHPPDKCRIW